MLLEVDVDEMESRVSANHVDVLVFERAAPTQPQFQACKY